MKIDQPQSPSPGAAGASGAPAADAGTHFEPIYRDGKLVSMVSVPNSPSPAQQQQTSATSAPQASSQFLSSGGNDPAALGESNAGLLEARKYARADMEHEPGYVAPRAVRQLTTATVLNARLMSKIESDLPGPVIAQITEPVYDSNTHTTVVVPAGTRVFGKYDEETVASSTRLLMSFTHLIFPDGEEFDMGGQAGSDVNGTAGFGGDVDQHRGTLYTTALLLTVVGGAEAAVAPPANSLTTGVTITQAAQSSAGAQLDQLGNKILNRAIDRPATIIIRPPYAFEIIVTRDLPLDQYAEQHQ
jgi:type IV secretion system protein VirB10